MKRAFRQFLLPAVAMITVICLISCGKDNNSTGNAPTGSLSGTITFRDVWPATGNVYVTVNSTYPPSSAPDAFTSPIPVGVRTFDYSLSGVEVGTYIAILIGWRGGPGDDKCIGMYWTYIDSLGVAADCSSVPPGPSPVTVRKGEDTPDIDMVADLGLAK